MAPRDQGDAVSHRSPVRTRQASVPAVTVAIPVAVAIVVAVVVMAAVMVAVMSDVAVIAWRYHDAAIERQATHQQRWRR
jgi:mannose/fructose/N-acetylgalactosamine-specific phosphotransferase system component IIC